MSKIEVEKIYSYPNRRLNKETGDWELISDKIFVEQGCDFDPDHVHVLEGRHTGRETIQAHGRVQGTKPNGEEYDVSWVRWWETKEGRELVKTRKGDALRIKGEAEWRRVGKNAQKRKWKD